MCIFLAVFFENQLTFFCFIFILTSSTIFTSLSLKRIVFRTRDSCHNHIKPDDISFYNYKFHVFRSHLVYLYNYSMENSSYTIELIFRGQKSLEIWENINEMFRTYVKSCTAVMWLLYIFWHLFNTFILRHGCIFLWIILVIFYFTLIYRKTVSVFAADKAARKGSWERQFYTISPSTSGILEISLFVSKWIPYLNATTMNPVLKD